MSKQEAEVVVTTDEPDVTLTKEEEAARDHLRALKEKAEQEKEEPEDEPEDDGLNEEDKKLKENLELLVGGVTDASIGEDVRKHALVMLGKEIRSSTSSMTAIPKPLKFLRPHYEKLVQFYKGMQTSNTKTMFADILSVLAMTMAKEGSLDSLQFKLEGNQAELGSWGHEYVRHIAGEIGTAFNQRKEKGKDVDDLMFLVRKIVPFHMDHNAESDACDLLMEVDAAAELAHYVTKDNYLRVCEYLIACSDYASDNEETNKLLGHIFDLYFKNVVDLPNALRVALRLNDRERVTEVVKAAEGDRLMQQQLGFIIGVQRLALPEFEDDDELMESIGNQHLSQHFKNLARELDVEEAKVPDDIYKSHLADSGPGIRRRGQQKVDSAKQNLAATFVNAFVNMGFGSDKLVTPEGADWMYKNKDHGMISAAASLGMILLWDLDTGFSTVDKYSFSVQTNIKAGALLGIGMISSGVQSDMDAALGLLSEHVESDDANMKIAAMFGIGISYCGSCSEEVMEYLVPVLVDGEQSMDVVAMAALSLGLAFVGSANDDLCSYFIETLLERSETELDQFPTRLIAIGLGLLFLNRGDVCEAALEALQTIEHSVKPLLELTVETFAYFGTGNMMQVQKLLTVCGPHIDDEKKNQHQAVAVLGLAMVSMGEGLASQMALRSLDHLLQYGEVNVRRVVPLALGLLSVSNPQLVVMDTLSKLTHDSDQEVSQNACLALGFLGAGTNNSRIANMLRQLAVYYAKEPNHLFLVRIAQGLLHMGKGLMTLSPFHSDNLLMSFTAAAGLLTVLHCSLDLKNSILSKRHYLLYALTTSARPRMLVTLDENLDPVAVKVRVGAAVDTVGQAGKPKKITGFQTHTTPVLLAANERAELATDEFIPMSTVLEGFVIVKKNPDAVLDEH